jgi:hypothetical protein
MAKMSLSDLIERQIDEQKDTTDAVDALNKQFTAYFKVLQRQKLPSEEQRRERGIMGRMLGGGSGSTGSEDGKGGGLFGGMFSGLFGGVFKSLTGTLGFILKPLKLLARLLLRGGPIAIAVGLLYAVFKDIGDNPEFQKGLEALKETWQKVKTSFLDLKDYFIELSDSPGIKSAVEMIKNWFVRLKENIQDFVIDSLFGISDVITGTLDVIKNVISGDFSGAFEGLKKAIMGVVTILDSAITNVLELFGVDFGENGTFLTYVGNIFTRLNTRLLGMWNDANTWIKDKYNSVIEGVKTKVGNLGQALEDFIVDSWKWITSWIPDPAKIAASIKQKVMDLIPDFIKDTVEFATVTASKYRLTDDMRAEQSLMQKPLVPLTETELSSQNIEGYLAMQQSRARIAAQNIARETDAFNRRAVNQTVNIGQVGDNVSTVATGAAKVAAGAAPLGMAVNTSLIQKRALQGGNMFMMGSPLLHLLN